MYTILLLLISLMVCQPTPSHISTFRRLFINWQSGYYRQRLDGSYEYIRQQVQDKLIQGHLKSWITVGTPTLNELNCVKYIAFDVDSKHPDVARSVTKRLLAKLHELGLKTVTFFSGLKGYHVYLYVQPVTLASVARKFGQNIVSERSFP